MGEDSENWRTDCPLDGSDNLTFTEGDNGWPVFHCFTGEHDWSELRAAMVEADWPADLLHPAGNGRKNGRRRKAEKEETPPLPKTSEEGVKLWRKALAQAGNGRGNTAARGAYSYLMERRGLTPETIQKYELGWHAGSSRITLPVRDAEGRLVNVRKYDRYADDDKMIGIKDHNCARLYPDVPTGEAVVLHEGEWDTLLARQLGIPAVTGTGGVSTFRSDWVPLFKGKRVALVLDAHSPSRKAAKKIAGMLAQQAEWVRIVDLAPERDDGYDFTDWAVKDGHTADDLFALIKDTPNWEPTEEWSSGDEAGAQAYEHDPHPYQWNAYGNGRRLVDLYGDRIRYCHPWKAWFVSDGRRWKRDDTAEVVRLMAETIATMYGELADMEEKEAKAFFQFIIRSQAPPQRKLALESASADPRVVVRPDEWDQDPWLLNVLNGTIDLRTGELHDHDQADRITKLAPHAYRPEAEAPLWAMVLERAQPDPEMREFIHKLIGYAATGVTWEKGYYDLYGETDTAKTTIIETVAMVLGDDYTQKLSINDLMLTRAVRGANNDGIANLKGKRFVWLSEPPENSRLDVSAIKDLTGGKYVTAMRKYEHPFTFQPECKIFIDTNHEPAISDTDDAIWNRTNVLPFKVRIPKSEQDPELSDKLRVEAEGILAWIVTGCLAWRRAGRLKLPYAAEQATEQYRQDQDPASGFFEDCCVLGPGRMVLPKRLRDAYLKWCRDNRVPRPLSSKAMAKRLREHGCELEVVRVERAVGEGGKKVSVTARHWVGIDLTERGPEDYVDTE